MGTNMAITRPCGTQSSPGNMSATLAIRAAPAMVSNVGEVRKQKQKQNKKLRNDQNNMNKNNEIVKLPEAIVIGGSVGNNKLQSVKGEVASIMHQRTTTHRTPHQHHRHNSHHYTHIATVAIATSLSAKVRCVRSYAF